MIRLHRTFELSHHTQKFPKVQVQSSPKNCLNFASRGILALKEITSKRQEARFGILLESRVTASVGTWLRQTRRRGTTRCLTRRRTTRWAGQKVEGRLALPATRVSPRLPPMFQLCRSGRPQSSLYFPPSAPHTGLFSRALMHEHWDRRETK